MLVNVHLLVDNGLAATIGGGLAERPNGRIAGTVRAGLVRAAAAAAGSHLVNVVVRVDLFAFDPLGWYDGRCFRCFRRVHGLPRLIGRIFAVDANRSIFVVAAIVFAREEIPLALFALRLCGQFEAASRSQIEPRHFRLLCVCVFAVLDDEIWEPVRPIGNGCSFGGWPVEGNRWHGMR